ncbi:MAG: hypothetical protein AB1420_17090 [Bacillota bacterium]
MGIRALVIEGQAQEDNFFVIKVTGNEIELLPVDEIRGRGNYETVKILFREQAGKRE